MTVPLIAPASTGSPDGGGAVHAAWVAAASAAGSAGVRVSTVADMETLTRVADLWRTVWSREAEAPVPVEMLRALAHAGNYVAAAWEGDTPVAALLAFYAGDAAHDHLHSHILGVGDGLRGRGVGFALKLHQRAWALERRARTVTWTYDPLVRGNAVFNIGKLGGAGVDYLVDFYGRMPDAINGSDPSDRVLVRWDLLGGVACAAAERRPSTLLARIDPAALALAADEHGLPVRRATLTGGIVACATPPDIVALRRTDAAAARRWRLALREVMLDAFTQGLRITGVTRDGSYLLTRPEDGGAELLRAAVGVAP